MNNMTESLTAPTPIASPTVNPMGLDGFEFVEYASPEPEKLEKLFLSLGFTPIAQHRSKKVTLFRQGKINFILNQEPHSHAAHFSQQHGPSACAMAFKVQDAQKAFARAVALGAKPFTDAKNGPQETTIPAIYGIGGSLLYFVDHLDHQHNRSIYDSDFIPFEGVSQSPPGAGLLYIDHLTHNVHQGEMDTWAHFYEHIFNFQEIRYFDIEGQKTGLISRALASPCGKIKIPLNESKDDHSQIEEYLKEYKGEGIQHVALVPQDIYTTVETLQATGTKFLTTPNTYYEMVNDRVKNHAEDLVRMQKDQILIDGTVDNHRENLLLQIFTENVIGPIFFEIIQRKGNQGFGEGNFKALFEAIERDQIRRGVL